MFDQIAVGQVFDGAPAVTLTSGMAGVHQAVLGDRLRLPLDAHLSSAVTGVAQTLAHPGLVCDVAIRQSTLATHHIKASLRYRGLVFRRFPVIGDTLYTRTEVVGLRCDKAALRVTTTDHEGRLVLDFLRFETLPVDPGAGVAGDGPDDDLATPSGGPEAIAAPTVSWDGDAFRQRIPGPHFDPSMAGLEADGSADVVTRTPELARLTLNTAAVQHEWRLSGRRLVYGGHAIGLALAQATRLLPNLATVLAWRSCDHTGPIYEGDTLVSAVRVECASSLPRGGGVLGLRSIVTTVGDEPRPVLDWRFSALQF